VPFTVKENVDLAGSPTTDGVVALAGAVPPLESPHVTRMKRAGAIPLGRTNLPDFGLRYHTDNALRGPTVNPWDPGRTPGGSSGGEAAALACGMTPLGLGNDYGGSLRWPAQCCGISSLRPTPGRIPAASSLQPVEPSITSQLFTVQGPMARRVADLRTAFEVMAGTDPRDPKSTPAPLRGPDAPRRAAVVLDPAGRGVDADVAAGIRKAAEALSDAGYEVEEAEPPMVAEGADLWERLVITDVRLLYPEIQPLLSPGGDAFVRAAMERLPGSDLAEFARDLAERRAVARAWSEFQARYPILLGPVGTAPPFPVGDDLAEGGVERLLRNVRLVLAVSLVGRPAAVVPVGEADGMPLAVQVIGPSWREDLCLDAAEAIEDRLGTVTPIDPRSEAVRADQETASG
jgi:amidase